MMNHGGISNHNGMIRNIGIDKCVRRDHYIVADMYIAYDGCIDADVNIITECWRTLSFSAVFCTDCAAFIQIAVVADYNVGADGDIVRMTEIQTFSAFFRTYFKTEFSG